MKRLLVSVALLPLLPAVQAHAQTTISDARTTPIATSTAANGSPDSVTIATSGSVRPSQPGAAVTLDSNSTVINRGAIGFTAGDNVTGVLVQGGRTGSLQNFGSISLVEDYSPADDDKDGDLDGVFAKGGGRYGLRLTGPGAFTGDVLNAVGGSIAVEGNDSAGISLESAVVGNVRSGGVVSVTGDRSVGIRAGGVSGELAVTGAVTVTGAGSVGVSAGDVGGRITLQSAVTATGYRYTQRPATDVRGKLDADDLLQGGSAVRISGSVGGGILLDRPPADASTTDDDEDDDGVKDAEEATAVLSVFGAAPALDLGGAGATRIGAVGTGANAYGLLIKGQVLAAGVYDGVTATGVRIGQSGGGATVIDGGVRLDGGRIEAGAFEADAAALLLNAGASAPVLDNGGRIAAQTTAETVRSATAVLVGTGAALPLLRNTGEISALVAGEKGDATAVLDRSGTLARIENSGVIRAGLQATDDADDKDDGNSDAADEAISGRAIAVDLRANTAGAVLVQTGRDDGDDGGDKLADPDADGDGVDDADEPLIFGDVLLGSGADRVELRNGQLAGRLDFGAGEDALLIDGGASLSGALSDSDGRLSVDLRKGSLQLLNTDTVRLSSLTVAADGALTVTVDPKANKIGALQVAGAATLVSGAQIDLRLTSLLKAPASYVVIDAASLQAGSLDTALDGAPYLYATTLRADAAAGDVVVDMRRRTAAELQLNRSETQAFDVVSASLDLDPRIEAAILGARTREDLVGLYDQLLPDHSGGSLMSAAAISAAISSAVVEGPLGRTGPGATGVWAQEIFFDIEQDRQAALGYEAQGFGFAAGVEEVAASGSALGLSVSYVSAEYNDSGAALEDEVVMRFGEVGLYGRLVRGGLRLAARAGVGYVGFESERKVVAQGAGLNLTSAGDWSGWLADAHLGASYEQAYGWLYARPELSLDYVRLQESDYQESGGGDGLDLAVDSRTGDLMTGVAALAIGARFGQGMQWGPEVKVGWRQRLAGDVGETTARFVRGGGSFTLNGEAPVEGAAIARLALKGQGDRTSVSIEGGAEANSDYRQYDVRAVLKLNF